MSDALLKSSMSQIKQQDIVDFLKYKKIRTNILHIHKDMYIVMIFFKT